MNCMLNVTWLVNATHDGDGAASLHSFHIKHMRCESVLLHPGVSDVHSLIQVITDARCTQPFVHLA
jgi:hypothetical protein